MKKKVNKYISSFDSIVYVLSHATKMQLFWSQLKANDVLSRVLLLLFLLFIYFLKQSKMFNSNTLMILYYDMWSNLNMPHDIKQINKN
jgi:ABC-type branched-subunit amino acid transport system substrate-binding protein